MPEPSKRWTSEDIWKVVEVIGDPPSGFPSDDPQFEWMPAIVTEAMIVRGARMLLADGGADLTAAPPGEQREEYARSLTEQILRAAFDA